MYPVIKVIVVLFSLKYFVTGEYSRGTSKIGSSSSRAARKLVNVAYMKCFDEVPNYVKATVKPSDSSLPHQFNLTVKRVEKYSFLVEILRTDLDSGWEELSLTVHWTAVMKAR
uniref:uncharacterized protein LOC113475559 n=1 Tax=Ciona intestinalis TaxID=7719 RepID=UPI000EF46248|nr:uncharacterized protein LOC113475559 [Ciona intestinalis]|eukprot:XP_026695585.1 uncharacterized protein LOC113475559 [Ciona intestinalis]